MVRETSGAEPPPECASGIRQPGKHSLPRAVARLLRRRHAQTMTGGRLGDRGPSREQQFRLPLTKDARIDRAAQAILDQILGQRRLVDRILAGLCLAWVGTRPPEATEGAPARAAEQMPCHVSGRRTDATGRLPEAGQQISGDIIRIDTAIDTDEITQQVAQAGKEQPAQDDTRQLVPLLPARLETQRDMDDVLLPTRAGLRTPAAANQDIEAVQVVDPTPPAPPCRKSRVEPPRGAIGHERSLDHIEDLHASSVANPPDDPLPFG